MGFKRVIKALRFDLSDENRCCIEIIGFRSDLKKMCEENPNKITKWISIFKDMINHSNKKETSLLILGFLAVDENMFSHTDLQQLWENCQISENKVSISEFRNKFLDIPKLIFLEKNGNVENTLEYSEAIEKYPVEFVKYLKEVINSFKDISFINQELVHSNKNESTHLSENRSEQPIINYGTQHIYFGPTYVCKQNEMKDFPELKNINLQSTSCTQSCETLQARVDNVEKDVKILQQSDKKRENTIDQLDERIKHVEGSSSASNPSLPHAEESIDSAVTQNVSEGIDNLPNAEKSHHLHIYENSNNHFVCIWEINDFDSLKSHPIRMTESDHFYTSKCGYKMCLRIYANGNGEEGYGTHLSVLYAVMKGDYDDKSRWPFSGVVTLTLLDNRKSIIGKKKHFSKEFLKCEYLECYKRPSEEYNEAYGDRTFYPLNKLSSESRYLKKGSIFLKMSIEL